MSLASPADNKQKKVNKEITLRLTFFRGCHFIIFVSQKLRALRPYVPEKVILEDTARVSHAALPLPSILQHIFLQGERKPLWDCWRRLGWAEDFTRVTSQKIVRKKRTSKIYIQMSPERGRRKQLRGAMKSSFIKDKLIQLN